MLHMACTCFGLLNGMLGLQQLGHSAIQLLDGSFEQDGLLNKGETRDMQASQLTFDFAFHACGGRETCEVCQKPPPLVTF